MVVLSNVITSLYDDPANTYVSRSDIIPIARDKIAGQPIEDRLLRARHAAQLEQRALKKLENEEMKKQKR